MAKPDITVDFEDKVAIAKVIIGQMSEQLVARSDEKAFTADDFVDLASLCLGALLANDTNLKLPRDFRLAGDVIGKRIEGYAKGLRQAQDRSGGASLFTQAVNEQQAKSSTGQTLN